MYGVFTYIYHKNHPNVGKYTIHGFVWEQNLSSYTAAVLVPWHTCQVPFASMLIMLSSLLKTSKVGNSFGWGVKQHDAGIYRGVFFFGEGWDCGSFWVLTRMILHWLNDMTTSAATTTFLRQIVSDCICRLQHLKD